MALATFKNIIRGSECFQKSRSVLINSYNIRTMVSNSFKVQNLEDFDEKVKKSDKPVIVDFFATWCNPCKLLGPRVESVIDEKKGKILLAKVDIDENSDLALDYDVNAVPVLLAFRNGKPEDRLIGLQDEDKIRTFVNKYVD